MWNGVEEKEERRDEWQQAWARAREQGLQSPPCLHPLPVLGALLCMAEVGSAREQEGER